MASGLLKLNNKVCVFQILGSWSALGWILACCSMISNGFGAAEIEQQGLHFSISGLLERLWLDSNLFSMISNGFGAAEIEQEGLHFSNSGTLERPELDSGLLLNNFYWLRGCWN